MSETELAAMESYVDSQQERFMRELQTYIRQPSTPAEDRGTVDEVCRTAELPVNLMWQAGIEARLLETATYPVVLGELKTRAGSSGTLLIYGHYGVVNPGNPPEWVVDQYSAEIRQGSIIGRGASDPKGNVIASFKAAESWLMTHGDVPVSLKFVFPCSERGKKDLAFEDTYRPLLDADSWT